MNINKKATILFVVAALSTLSIACDIPRDCNGHADCGVGQRCTYSQGRIICEEADGECLSSSGDYSCGNGMYCDTTHIKSNGMHPCVLGTGSSNEPPAPNKPKDTEPPSNTEPNSVCQLDELRKNNSCRDDCISSYYDFGARRQCMDECLITELSPTCAGCMRDLLDGKNVQCTK